MKVGPDIARIAALIGDPARANMLAALMDGRALTASELAGHAGIMPSTASTHLGQLVDAAILTVEKQGRHRYYRLSDHDIAELLESLMGIAERTGQTRLRTGPKEPALRKARICYDHLAGDYGVMMLEKAYEKGWLRPGKKHPALTPDGRAHFQTIGVDVAALESKRRPICRECLDWSARRPHLAGALGAATLMRFRELGWARQDRQTRAILFSPDGERHFRRFLGL